MADAQQKEPMVLAHVVWMDRYAGDVETIVPSSFNWRGVGHEQKDSGEQFNFEPVAGTCRGYTARHFRDKDDEFRWKKVNLKRLGGTAKSESVTPVTVVWTAVHPETRARVVVGWYVGATAFHEAQLTNDDRFRFYFEAPVANCFLLPPERRDFTIELARDRADGKGPGQDGLFYVDERAPELATKLRRFMARNTTTAAKPKVSPPPPKSGGGSPRQPDLAKRLAVEKAAIETVRKALGSAWTVDDNQKENLGWDLTATAPGKPELRIEVKGVSGWAPTAEVTPNETKAMDTPAMRTTSLRYVIAIVTDALTPANRRLRAFAWQREWKPFDVATARFRSNDPERLNVTPVMAARLTVTSGGAA